MFGIIFQAKTTTAVLALAAQFFVSQRELGGENNSDCLPAALDAAIRAVGRHVDATTLARERPDGTIAPGVTADVLKRDRSSGDPKLGELERLRIELTGGKGLSSGVAFGPSGLQRNTNGHDHGTPVTGVPGALASEGLRGIPIGADERSVMRALAGPKHAVVMGGTVGTGAWASCHATTAVGIDPATHKVVVLDPELGPSEKSLDTLHAYFNPSSGNRTIFGCPSFAYEVDG